MFGRSPRSSSSSTSTPKRPHDNIPHLASALARNYCVPDLAGEGATCRVGLGGAGEVEAVGMRSGVGGGDARPCTTTSVVFGGAPLGARGKSHARIVTMRVIITMRKTGMIVQLRLVASRWRSSSSFFLRSYCTRLAARCEGCRGLGFSPSTSTSSSSVFRRIAASSAAFCSSLVTRHRSGHSQHPCNPERPPSKLPTTGARPGYGPGWAPETILVPFLIHL